MDSPKYPLSNDPDAVSRLLHFLRNPYGRTRSALRQARLDAADLIEYLDAEFKRVNEARDKSPMEQIIDLLADHYWDSLTPHKELILKHVAGALQQYYLVSPRPAEIEEWMNHLTLHMTEHDSRHAKMALNSAWPPIERYIEQLEVQRDKSFRWPFCDCKPFGESGNS